jgi:hypothetical protein
MTQDAPVDPSTFRPRLTLMATRLPTILAECEDHAEKCKANQRDMALKLAVLVAAVDSAGTISDNTLDSAIYNRRQLLQQGCMQSKLIVQQLEANMQAIIDLRTAVDQMLNITLPQFEAARTRS